jgi:hypothetical protein
MNDTEILISLNILIQPVKVSGKITFPEWVFIGFLRRMTG